jgi:hypothetical protein
LTGDTSPISRLREPVKSSSSARVIWIVWLTEPGMKVRGAAVRIV